MNREEEASFMRLSLLWLSKICVMTVLMSYRVGFPTICEGRASSVVPLNTTKMCLNKTKHSKRNFEASSNLALDSGKRN